jgi:hypothetical protein
MVLPILLYGAAESWALTDAQLHRLDVFHTTSLRRITGHGRGPDCISNNDLFELTHQQPLREILRRHRMRWLGHAARRPDGALVKQLLFAAGVHGSPRPRGRPHLTWMDMAMHDVADLGVSDEWERVAQDRAQWQALLRQL